MLQNGFAAFTRNQSGSGPALAENYISDSEQSANTLNDSARPGQTILLYGTGLGPASFDETGPPQPEDFDLNVEVYVGGKPARVLYKGRSSCCAGVDQIRFVVPESVQGCYVPVVVRTGDFISNFATIAVDPYGKPCSDPNRISLDDLQRIQNGESFRIGSISLGRSATIGNADLNLDSAFASFVQYDASQWLGENLYGLYPGACTVFTFRSDAAVQNIDPVQGERLDAGTVININGPKGSKQLVGNNGFYHGILGGSQGAPDFLEAGTYVIDNGAGGGDIGPFHTTVNIATPLASRKRSVAGNHRPQHFRHIVAETNGLDHFARELIVLWIKCVDMAHAAAHEQKDYILGARRRIAGQAEIISRLGPQVPHGRAEETEARLEKELAPVDPTTGKW